MSPSKACREGSLGERTDEKLRRSNRLNPDPPPAAEPQAEPPEDTRESVDDGTLPAKLPRPPELSRVDTLPEGFFNMLSRRPLFIGDVISARYKLVEALGDGGMGQVFVAENLAIGRRVAVKLLKAELLADPHFRMRFQHEAQAIAAIEHRNVARFLDLIVGDPTFLVMEYVPGPTLAEVLQREKRLDQQRAVRLAARLCWGLEAAHRAGVVQRDLKPANVILSPDAEHGEEPKIIDFGLAKLAYAPAEQQLTRAGQIVGTPHYMSPEQVENREIDPRTDVYALGCLLYHMLAGRPPFQGVDDLAVLYQQVQNPPDPLSKHVPTAAPELEAIVMRALAKEPSRRFSSTKEMALALGAIGNRRDALDGSQSTQLVRAPTSKAGGVPLLLVAALSLLVGGAAVWRLAHRADAGALLVVGTHPIGAHVEIDGRGLADVTPAVIRGMTPGPHRVRVSSGSSAAEEQVVTIHESERAIVDFSLSAATRNVELQTVPAGALVYVDQRLQPAQTPLSIQITAGEFHGIRVEKPGFVPVNHAVKPEDEEPQLSFNLQVEREPRGVLWVDSNQSARVFVDGADRNLLAPTVGMLLSVGAHTVELRDNAGATLVKQAVKIEQGDSLHVTLDGCTPSPVGGGR